MFTTKTFQKKVERTENMSKELSNLIENFTIGLKEVELKEEIGRGHLGIVSRGICRGKDVAVKKLLNQDLKENEIKDLQQEVSKMGQMRHPNLALLMGGIFEKGQVSIITELLDKNLVSIITDINVSQYKRIDIAISIAKGVNWLHESKPPLIHLNLKPENVLLNKDLNGCKICDTGLGSIRDDGKSDNWFNFIYKSPEALEKLKVETSSDVFSFGVILYELMSKKRAYDTKDYPNLEKFKSAIKEGKRPEISSKDVPETASSIITSCWSQRASSRPSLSNVIKQLEKTLVEFAISDSKAKEFWNLCYSGQTFVRYKELESDLMDFLDIGHLEIPELGKFLKYLIKQENGEFIELEHFGKIWTWFGPLKSGNETLNNIKEILISGWYHGELSASEAENRLAKRPTGTYLVRLSATKPGNFTISKMGKSGISHIRIKSKKGVFTVTVPNSKKKTTIKEEMPLQSFIKKISKPLELKKPCQGSPYVLANASCYEGDDGDDSDD